MRATLTFLTLIAFVNSPAANEMTAGSEEIIEAFVGNTFQGTRLSRSSGSLSDIVEFYDFSERYYSWLELNFGSDVRPEDLTQEQIAEVPRSLKREGIFKAKNYSGKWRFALNSICFQIDQDPERAEDCFYVKLHPDQVVFVYPGQDQVFGSGTIVNGNPYQF